MTKTSNPRLEAAQNRMAARLGRMSDAQIVDAIRQIGTPKTVDLMTVRVSLCEEYERRHGEDALDAVFDMLDAEMGI